MQIKIPIPRGERNNTLFEIGKLVRSRNTEGFDVLMAITVFNALCEQPLPPAEVSKLFDTILKVK